MKYNVAQIVPKMGKHKGQTRYYAKPTPTRKIGFEEVIRDISEMSSLTSGDVRNAIDRLSYYLRRELAAGNTVQLGQIGTFRIIAASRHVEHEEQVTTAIIKRPRILLHLTKELRSATRELQLSVHNPKAKGEAPKQSQATPRQECPRSTPAGALPHGLQHEQALESAGHSTRDRARASAAARAGAGEPRAHL